jgi:hypothetical protein
MRCALQNMFNQMDAYLKYFMEERLATWPVFAILFICFGFIIRSFIFKPVLRRAKEINRKDYAEVKKQYLKRAIWGWIFFALSLLFSLQLWESSWPKSLSHSDVLMLVGAILSFTLSLIFHLMAIACASFIVLEKHNPEL